MKILTFHLCGKMAHFRRYYSNSSALSYSVPPRITIAGIIAGLLGYERDSYYDRFSLDRCKIGVSLGKPIKKQVQKLNLLMVKKLDDLNGSEQYHSQTPTELILPHNIQVDNLDYQIWFSHEDTNLMAELQRLFAAPHIAYGSRGISVALGTANNLGWLEFGGEFEGYVIQTEEAIPIVSVLPVTNIKEIVMKCEYDPQYRLVKEELPLEFDQQRRITCKGIGAMVINLTPSPVYARVHSYVSVNNGVNITWME